MSENGCGKWHFWSEIRSGFVEPDVTTQQEFPGVPPPGKILISKSIQENVCCKYYSSKALENFSFYTKYFITDLQKRMKTKPFYLLESVAKFCISIVLNSLASFVTDLSSFNQVGIFFLNASNWSVSLIVHWWTECVLFSMYCQVVCLSTSTVFNQQLRYV